MIYFQNLIHFFGLVNRYSIMVFLEGHDFTYHDFEFLLHLLKNKNNEMTIKTAECIEIWSKSFRYFLKL